MMVLYGEIRLNFISKGSLIKLNIDRNISPNATSNLFEMALAVADHIDAMLAYCDKNQVCRFANNAYFQWFGISRDEMIGVRMEELLGHLYSKNLPFIMGALEGHVQVFEREVSLPSGITGHCIVTYTPDIVDGVVQGFFVHAADVTQMKIIELELQAEKKKAEFLATHDFLTGLPNRVLLMDRISNAVLLTHRINRIIAVINMDMDNFKAVNDTYGHHEGDLLLKEIAKRLRKVTRESDTITRIGGDEFILLVQGVESVEDIEVIASKILDSVRHPYACQNGELLTPTFSIGIAVHPIDGHTPQDLLISSDNAMYEAKKQGRNRYCFNERPNEI